MDWDQTDRCFRDPKDINFHDITVFNILQALKGLFWPFVIGTTTVALVSAFVSYWLVLFLIKRFRKV
ncbi:MAG: DUF2062 domain-containing protein [Nitrospirae bacterium]|nr:MAG: DUF2062 domain-containing protein [Nitrospirota bacterium]